MQNHAKKMQRIEIRRATSLTLVAHNEGAMHRRMIAMQAEEAAHLPGNDNSVDYEEFLSQYSPANASDFA